MPTYTAQSLSAGLTTASVPKPKPANLKGFSIRSYNPDTHGITVTNDVISVVIEPVRHCCGAVMIHGLDSDGYLGDCEVDSQLRELHDFLTDYDHWQDMAGGWDIDLSDHEDYLSGYLRRSKLMFVDAVGGEDGRMFSLWRMGRLCKWSFNTINSVHNTNSGNQIVSAEWSSSEGVEHTRNLNESDLQELFDNPDSFRSYFDEDYDDYD